MVIMVNMVNTVNTVSMVHTEIMVRAVAVRSKMTLIIEMSGLF